SNSGSGSCLRDFPIGDPAIDGERLCECNNTIPNFMNRFCVGSFQTTPALQQEQAGINDCFFQENGFHMVALSPVRTPVSRLHRTKTSPAQFPPHEIERGARALWARSGYGVLTNVEPVAYGGTLVLRGRVPSYFHKQLA